MVDSQTCGFEECKKAGTSKYVGNFTEVVIGVLMKNLFCICPD